jgi:hypothetical protein
MSKGLVGKADRADCCFRRRAERACVEKSPLPSLQTLSHSYTHYPWRSPRHTHSSSSSSDLHTYSPERQHSRSQGRTPGPQGPPHTHAHSRTHRACHRPLHRQCPRGCPPQPPWRQGWRPPRRPTWSRPGSCRHPPRPRAGAYCRAGPAARDRGGRGGRVWWAGGEESDGKLGGWVKGVGRRAGPSVPLRGTHSSHTHTLLNTSSAQPQPNQT